MAPILSIRDLRKSYGDGAEALKGISLDIEEDEVIAFIGPNRAGKTMLISTICGLLRASSGSNTVNGFDIVDDYRKARALIGLVPQEIMLESFQKVKDALHHSRGLFNRPPDPAEKTVPVGQAGRTEHDAFRRDAAPGVDRQGAESPAAHPVP